jgi:hypothetical protein
MLIIARLTVNVLYWQAVPCYCLITSNMKVSTSSRMFSSVSEAPSCDAWSIKSRKASRRFTPIHVHTNINIIFMSKNQISSLALTNTPHLSLHGLLLQSETSIVPATPVFLFEWQTVSNRAEPSGSSVVVCRVATNGIWIPSGTRVSPSCWTRSLPCCNTETSYVRKSGQVPWYKSRDRREINDNITWLSSQ